MSCERPPIHQPRRRNRPGLAAAALVAVALCLACDPGDSQANENTAAASDTSAASGNEASSTEDESGSGSSATFTDSSTGDASSGGTPSGPEVIDYAYCPLDSQSVADINGFTNQGEYAGRYAWFGWLTCNGEAISPSLVVTETIEQLNEAVGVSPDGDAIPRPSLEFSLFGACDPAGEWVGAGSLNVYLRDAAGWQQARGRFEITQTHRMFDLLDPDDPPFMVGELEITDQVNGWELSGPFTAAYCGPLSYALDCQ